MIKTMEGSQILLIYFLGYTFYNVCLLQMKGAKAKKRLQGYLQLL